jgi:malonyl-CoA O-methyltransferase
MSPRSRTPNPAVISPQEGYELWAASYGENMNPVQTLESQAIKELLPPLEGCTLLDLGCGKGRVSRLALERGAKRTVGMDFSLQMLRGAVQERSSDSAHYLAGGALHLPFKRETFDVVACALLIGHIQDLEGVLSQISEVLRPGGYLLITDFHPYETLRGSVRSFKDERNNRTYSIKQHLHTFEDYIRIFNKLKLVLEDLREPQYENFPLVFALSARKPSEN